MFFLIDKPIKGWMVTVRFQEEFGEVTCHEYLHGTPSIMEVYPTYHAAADAAEAILLNHGEAIYDLESVEEPLRSQILIRDNEESYAAENRGILCGWWCSLLLVRVTITAIVEA